MSPDQDQAFQAHITQTTKEYLSSVLEIYEVVKTRYREDSATLARNSYESLDALFTIPVYLDGVIAVAFEHLHKCKARGHRSDVEDVTEESVRRIVRHLEGLPERQAQFGEMALLLKKVMQLEVK